MSSVTVVVPAYNEGSLFAAALSSLSEYFAIHRGSGYEFHFLIVDDGSTDETGAVAATFARWRPNVRVVRHEHNRGLGAALRTAFAAVDTDLAVLLDADLTYSPAVAMRLVEELEASHADIAMASPYMPGGSVVGVPFLRRVLSREANRLLSLAVCGKYATLTCMVRAFRVCALRELQFRSDDKPAVAEMLLDALRKKMRVVEVPATLEWTAERRCHPRQFQYFTHGRANVQHACAGLSSSPRAVAGGPRALSGAPPARRRAAADTSSQVHDARHRHDRNDRRSVHEPSPLYRANHRFFGTKISPKTSPSNERSTKK